jgi:hypothetical protein
VKQKRHRRTQYNDRAERNQRTFFVGDYCPQDLSAHKKGKGQGHALGQLQLDLRILPEQSQNGFQRIDNQNTDADDLQRK